MSAISNTIFRDVGIHLRDHKYQDKYFTPEKYSEAKNPLESLVVIQDVTKFFGTKVCNIFVVSIPFGWKFETDWVEEWPPLGYAEAKARHIETFEVYAKYQTHVYMDMNIVNKIMAATPDSKFQEMMIQTKVRMQEMCMDLAAYGFTFEADITSDVGPEYFYSVLDDFYGSD